MGALSQLGDNLAVGFGAALAPLNLLLGVVGALLAANLAHEWYEHALHWAPFGDFT